MPQRKLGEYRRPHWVLAIGRVKGVGLGKGRYSATQREIERASEVHAVGIAKLELAHAEGSFVERIEITRKQLIIFHIFDPPEQRVMIVKIPIYFGEKCGQRAAGIAVLGGKSSHRGEAAAGIMHAGCGAMFIFARVNGLRFL